MITLTHYLTLSALLFAIGLVGVMRRQNLLLLFFSTEILLNSVNVGLVACSHYLGNMHGQLFAFFVIALAAAEVAVGLGLLILLYKRKGSLDLNVIKNMNG
ncbi:NADH-quinone oxidoreductase subunit K [Campylobacterota bacterium]|nr:NADH-quinone oxidoreductase subunit K [Campylobacterota bacterium]GHV04280.1 NADH-quinone oxidoreductase subunit K [Campylobacterota bacterium]